MREITVRAFNRRTNQWLYFSIGQQWSDVQNALYSELCLNGVVFYQYTGLKDKTKWEQLSESEKQEWLKADKVNTPDNWNGKEIYEGDIVKPFSDDINIAQIIYIAPSFVIATKKKDGSYLLWSYFKDEIEVIGNIYEHKHLLKCHENTL